MSILEKHIVPETAKSQYLNTYAPLVFENLFSKSKAKVAIAEGNLKVNGKRVTESCIINAGDKIEFLGFGKSEKKTKQKRALDTDIEIVFEDDYFAAINKPSGMQVMGNQRKTLENALIGNLKPSTQKDALENPVPLHRLDEPTTGLVLVAKTHRMQVEMGKVFQNKKIQKRYKAVVNGWMKGTGEYTTPIDKKPSITKYKVLKSIKGRTYESISIVELYPVTGRTHQLRIHLSENGFPIVGDKYYSKGKFLYDEKGLFLCSDQVIFTHPITDKEVKIEIDVPRKYHRFFDREAKASGKFKNNKGNRNKNRRR